MGEMYQPAWYGDSEYYMQFDWIKVFAPLGLYDKSKENGKRLEAIRWIQIHIPPGGMDKLTTERVEDSEHFLDAIFYFLLDPIVTPPADPRPDIALEHFAPGLGRLLARTSWGADAAWFAYNLGWLTVDHQHSHNNHFEFYRQGEWLTKEHTGYGNYGSHVETAEYHNTLSVENDMPERVDPEDPDAREDYRYFLWRTGSQWLYNPEGDGIIISLCMEPDFIYALGDATELYNSDYENVHDVIHVSRSIIWLKPDHIIIFDRATTKSEGRFKRFWLQFPSLAVVNGKQSIMTTDTGQQLFITTLLPNDAVITSEQIQDLSGMAEGESMIYRLKVESPDYPKDIRFLHVLQGADTGASADDVHFIKCDDGISFTGVTVNRTLVLFPMSLNLPFSQLKYTVSSDITNHLITGLDPNESYDVSTELAGDNIQITIQPGTEYQANSGGVLRHTISDTNIHNWTKY